MGLVEIREWEKKEDNSTNKQPEDNIKKSFAEFGKKKCQFISVLSLN